MKITIYIETNFKKLFSFNSLFWVISGIIFVLIALRAFFIPFSHDETFTFFSYIQPSDYLPYKAHIYTNNHVLNSALANICYHIWGSHPFVLRLPNILSFVLLCMGVFKHFKYLQSLYSKIILITFFLLTINFLDFFELCRGYGLSFGFIVLGLAYLMDYFQDKKIMSLILFSLCLQLALAANLILVVLLTILLISIFIFQMKNKLFFKLSNIVIQIINIAILIFWIKFSFFYKEHNSLDSGIGNDYWEVTFKSIMFFLFGITSLWLQIVTLCIFFIILGFSIRIFFRHPISIDKIFTPQLFYAITLIMLIIAFYIQKKLLDVNFPENRTGMFFYLLFILSFAFVIDSIPQKISSKISLLFLIPSIIFFITTYNISNFSFWFYQTIPKSFYNILKDEVKNDKEIITIGGGDYCDLNYPFLNYRGDFTLNVIDIPKQIQMAMNCDYYIAQKYEKTYYNDFYDEIAFDNKWNRVLLKRKEKIQRIELYKMPETPKSYKGKDEYFEFFRLKDSALKTKNCIEVELEIKFNAVPIPIRDNIVVQVNDNKGESIYYKTIALNWLADDLNGKTKRMKLTTGTLPENTHEIVVYLWNQQHSEIDFTINEIKVLELQGKGVNFVIPESHYKLNR